MRIKDKQANSGLLLVPFVAWCTLLLPLNLSAEGDLESTHRMESGGDEKMKTTAQVD